jgi:hypothetical protein
MADVAGAWGCPSEICVTGADPAGIDALPTGPLPAGA